MLTPNNFQVWSAVTESISLPFRHLPYITKVAFIPVCGFILLDWLTVLMQTSYMLENPSWLMPEASSLVLLTLAETLTLVKVLCLVPLALHLHKLIASGEKTGHFLPSVGGLEARYSLLVIVMTLTYAIPFFVCGLALVLGAFKFLLMTLSHENLAFVLLSVPVLAHVVGITFASRVCIALPALAGNLPISVIEAWKSTRCMRGRLIVYSFLLTFPVLVLYIVGLILFYLPIFASITEPPEVLGALIMDKMNSDILFAAPIGLILVVVVASGSSVIYKRLTA